MLTSDVVEALADVQLPTWMSPALVSRVLVPRVTVLVSPAVRRELTPAPVSRPPLSIITLSVVLRSWEATIVMLPREFVAVIAAESPTVTAEVPVIVDVVSEAEPLIAPPAPPWAL